MNNQNNPLVSVIIPCYNHEDFVQETIQSVIDQDYQNIELIIIDDGSKDTSVQKIEEMREACESRFSRFKFRHRPNKGLCATLNEGLDWSKGKYFTPSASDDILSPCKISKQIKVLQNSGAVGVFTGICIINDKKEIITNKGQNRKISFNEAFLRKYLMPGQTLMLSTSAVKNINGYDTSIAIEDLDIILRLCSKNYYFISIKTPLVYYRRHENNLSSNHQVMIEAVKFILSKYKHHKLYKQALSNSIMIEAHGLQHMNKTASLNYMKEALNIYPMNIFSISLFKYIIKMILK